MMDPRTKELIEQVDRNLSAHHGADHIGLYPFGSIAWGDYVPTSSDVDLLAVSAGPVDDLPQLVPHVMNAAADSEPLAGLDLVGVTADQARQPSRPTVIEYAISAYRDAGWETILHERGPAADATPMLAIANVERTGARFSGPPATEVFGETPDEWLLEACGAEMHYWAGREEITGHPVRVRSSILNACRAMRFARTAQLGSKLQGGEWALQHLDARFHEIITTALALQSGLDAELPANDAIRDLVGESLDVLHRG